MEKSTFLENTQDRLLASLIAVVPLFVFWSDIDQGHIYGLFLGAFIFLALSMSNKILSLFMLYAAGWFGYWVSSYFVGLVIGDAVLAGVDAILFLIVAAIIYEGIVKSKKPRGFWLNWICASAIIQAVLAITQYHFTDPVGWTLSHVVNISYGTFSPHSPVGTLVNSNYLGAFIGISLPFFVRRKWWIVIPVIIYALYAANCRAVNMAILIVTAFTAVRYSDWFFDTQYKHDRGMRYAFIAGIVAASIVALYYFGTSKRMLSVGERYVDYWRFALQTSIGSWQHFLFGVGPGITLRPVNNNLHNEYVSWLGNYGLIGLSIIGAYIGTTIRVLWRENMKLLCAVLIALIDMQANHLLHIPTTGLLVIFVAALAQREVVKNAEI